MIAATDGDSIARILPVAFWTIAAVLAAVFLLAVFWVAFRRWLLCVGRRMLAAPVDSSLRTFWAQTLASIFLAMLGLLVVLLFYDGERFIPEKLSDWHNALWVVAAIAAAVVLAAIITGCVAVIHRRVDREHANVSSDIRNIATDLAQILDESRRDADQQMRDYATMNESLNRLYERHPDGPSLPDRLREQEAERCANGADGDNWFPRIHVCLTIDRSIPRLDRAMSFHFQERLMAWNSERYAPITEELADLVVWKGRDRVVWDLLKSGHIVADTASTAVEWGAPAYFFESFGLGVDQFLRKSCLRAAGRGRTNLLSVCEGTHVVLHDGRCYRIPRAIRLLTSSIEELLGACRALIDAERRHDARDYLRDFPGLIRSGVLNVWLKDCRPESMNVMAWSTSDVMFRSAFSKISPNVSSVIEDFQNGWDADQRIHVQIDRDQLRRLSEVYSGWRTPTVTEALAVGNEMFVLGLKPQEAGSGTAGFLEVLPVIGMALNSKKVFVFDELLATITRDLGANRARADQRLQLWRDCLYASA